MLSSTAIYFLAFLAGFFSAFFSVFLAAGFRACGLLISASLSMVRINRTMDKLAEINKLIHGAIDAHAVADRNLGLRIR